MKKSEIKEMPGYYIRYIDLVPDIELSKALDDSMDQLLKVDREMLEKISGKSYAQGKWTPNDIFQHLIDAERIFNFRMLLFAREDNPVAPGFDQDIYVMKAASEKREMSELINELITVRAATKSLLESFDEKTLMRKGKSWDYEISILAMGFTIAGHQFHHFNVLKEKYYPLIEHPIK